MPRFSIVVPAYNAEPYLARCLDSIGSQTLSDYEVLVVNDGSEDGTLALAKNRAETDKRIHVIDLPQNGGQHRARIAGVAQSAGDYLIFLDADDELSNPHVLELLDQEEERDSVDILRFKLEVCPENGTSAGSAEGFECWSNRPSGKRPSREMLLLAFTQDEDHSVPWNMSHRLFEGDATRRAFSSMRQSRLDRAEDAYEYFVAASFAADERDCDIMGYRYHMGDGITNETALSVEAFIKDARCRKECWEAAQEATLNSNGAIPEECWAGFKFKLSEATGTMWYHRVASGDKEEAARELVNVYGPALAGREFYRFVRDLAYDYVAQGTLPQDDQELDLLCRIVRQVHVDEGLVDEDLMRFLDMRKVASSHLHDLRRARKFAAYDQEDVRIFVTTHKRVNVPSANCIQPVQVGPGNATDRFQNTYHDCDGQNIADLNPLYCELTTQYWAWKNVKADYYGFCHYRRYFNFSEQTYPENPYGEVMDDFIDEANLRKYGLDDQSIKSCVKGYDFITTGFHDLRDFPGDFTTPLEHYADAPKLHVEDLDRMAQIVNRLYPDYAQDVDSFLHGHQSCFCNMFIMRRQLFFDYCAWLFPILDAFVKETDLSLYSKEALRTPGHLAERLLNIYYLHGIRVGAGWKTKQLQCVHFERPDATPHLKPYAEVLGRKALPGRVVPVVFAADDNYVPMLATTIASMLEHADPRRPLDIVVFERNISYLNKKALVDFVAAYPHALLRFFDVNLLIAGYDLSTNNDHISLETYYRFLVQKVLGKYDKVLYLDSDLVVLDDVCKLYDTDLGDNLLAATRDVDYLGNLNMPDGIRMKYTRETLRMANPYDYFQAGVLVLNVAQMRRLHTVQEWLDIASQGGYIYDDQDILNAECEGRVTYLPADWNVTHDCFNRVANVYSFAPVREFDAYNDSRNHPRILHYAGAQKPWDDARCDFAPLYWRYARMTPFYEALLQRLSCPTAPAPAVVPVHEKAVSEDSPLRRYIDPIAPLGSARREVLKSIGRAVQGKK